jgi:hypothetical protein
MNNDKPKGPRSIDVMDLILSPTVTQSKLPLDDEHKCQLWQTIVNSMLNSLRSTWPGFLSPVADEIHMGFILPTRITPSYVVYACYGFHRVTLSSLFQPSTCS